MGSLYCNWLTVLVRSSYSRCCFRYCLNKNVHILAATAQLQPRAMLACSPPHQAGKNRPDWMIGGEVHVARGESCDCSRSFRAVVWGELVLFVCGWVYLFADGGRVFGALLIKITLLLYRLDHKEGDSRQELNHCQNFLECMSCRAWNW